MRKINFDKAKKLDVLVEGVRVTVSIDEHGNPFAASTGVWLGGDEERLAKLALATARAKFQREADRKAKAAKDATRTAKSTKTKREKARAHWSGKWLAIAHRKCPGYKAERLMQEARRILAFNENTEPEEYAKRDEITEHRANEFLKGKRSK